ncbi:energy-coupling factor transporter transmembrane component T family protein [Mesobacillus thioparans]|uniref:energy-coupling factor transporter transmembrane component T family protein n=1 Tax=Mesobacillus thioparans TaxID=370439 RepID=UPI0039EE7E8B
MPIQFDNKMTWLHRINPSVKLLGLACLFVVVLFIHNLNVMVLFALGPAILFLFFTGHPFKRILLFSIPFLLIFLSTSSSMILFGKGESTLFKWGLIHITEESLYRGIHLGFRALIYAMLGLTFALTTSQVLLFYSLMQQLKLNPKYAYSFMAGIRLIPIMIEELTTIKYARTVRGIQNTFTVRGILSSIKGYSIPLLSQSIRRAYRIAVAMEAKRFTDSRKRTYYYQTGFSRYDLIFIAYFALFLSLVIFISGHYPLFPVVDVRSL